MTPDELIQTIYLGDRGCKGIDIDFWEHKIKLKIDCISRVRSPSGHWEYYNDENIEDGYIVFSGVESYKIDPMGAFADDFIYGLTIKNIENDSFDNKLYTFVFEVGYLADAEAVISKTMEIEIIAKDLWLEDPNMPSTRMID